MYKLGTIRTYKTANFTVIVDAVEEECPDLSYDDTGETAAKIESGEYVLFCARARVLHEDFGEIASDYLGNCVYESLEDFRTSVSTCTYPDGRVVKAGYCGDMVREVCREARLQLIRMRAAVSRLHVREPK